MWSRSSGSTSSSQSLREAEGVELQKEEEGEGSGCLDLSLEQFPLLLGPKKTDSVADTQFNQSEVISPQAGNLGICFGSFGPLVGQSSPVTGKKVGSCLTGETPLSCSLSEKGKEPESLESNHERSVGF